MKNEAMQTAGEMASNKIAAGVAAGTVAVSSASLLQLVQSWLSLAAVAAGLVLSLVLIRKHWVETEIIRKRAKEGKDNAA